MKVFIWGTGEIATKYMKNDEIQRDLEGFIQIKRDKEIFLGKPVYTPDEISKMDYDLIFVLILGENDEISNVAEATHIDKDKIIYIEYNYWYDGTKASFFNNPPRNCYWTKHSR